MCLVYSSGKRPEVRIQMSEMSVLGPQERPGRETRSQIGADFDRIWLANDWTGSGRQGEWWG